jgi:PAS domain S-box-containing protein
MSPKATRFESLLEAVPDALVGMDQKGVIRFVNRQTESLFGYDRDDLIGQRIEMLVPESLWQIYAEHRQDYFADPRTRSSGLELVLSGRQRDGTEFPINISLSHIDTGDVLLVVTAVRDVTQQKQAVKDAQLTAAIVQYSDDAIISDSLDGIITSWNPAAERMYGYLSAEVIGKHAKFLTPKDRTTEIGAVLKQIKAGQNVEHLETLRVRKDGTVFPVSLTISPIRDANGAVVGASVICRDVTALKLAVRYTRSLIEATLDPLVTISPEGKITDVNEATVKVTGVPRNELIGSDFSGYFTDPDKANRIYRLVSAQGSVTNYPLTMRHRDGTVTEVLYNASVYRDTGGNVLGVLAAARDVTKQVHAQRETAEQQARELERLAELELGQRLAVGGVLKMIEQLKNGDRRASEDSSLGKR